MTRSNKEDFQLNGLLDKGCSFEGKLMFDGTVQVNGDFKGEILSDGTLIIGNEAQLNAKIQVNSLIVDGSIEGTIEAKGKVELHRGSKVIANIITPSLVIEEGAIFHGQCQMLNETHATRGAQAMAGSQPMMAEEGDDSLMM